MSHLEHYNLDGTSRQIKRQSGSLSLEGLIWDMLCLICYQ